MSILDLKRYRPKFKVYNRGLQLGGGTEVEILNLKSEIVKKEPDGSVCRRVTAIVELSTEVYVSPDRACAICKKAAPGPEHSHDALWFVLENHDGGRYVFPYEEGCADERDRYPVTGWTKGDGGLVCPSCTAEIEAAKQAAITAIQMRRKYALLDAEAKP